MPDIGGIAGARLKSFVERIERLEEERRTLGEMVMVDRDRVYGLTRTQRDCLLVIQELCALDGIAPSYAEIMAEMDVASRGSVHRMVATLRSRGYVTWRPGSARSLVVLQPIPVPEEPAIALTPLAAAALGRRR